jgi:hypothetical protein
MALGAQALFFNTHELRTEVAGREPSMTVEERFSAQIQHSFLRKPKCFNLLGKRSNELQLAMNARA